MEFLGGGKKEIKEALRLLNIALKMDEDYVQTYIGFVCAYGAIGDDRKREDATKTAYEKTLKKFPKWPKKMEWGWLENRAYLRAIQYMGDLYWDNGEKEKAIELFRLLLKLNPNDNQGVRYEIAALYAGLTGTDVNKMMDNGNQRQDWSELEDLVQEQNKKHKFWKEPKY
ncbi:tetratricopeptide repeat protein [Candidatus Azambacteria bacterium]|nr:tetratricopeptide repeat protein [Candidatus Azambacteria bacterium]